MDNKTRYLTLIFENCEDLIIEVNNKVSFHIEELKKGYNLSHESGEMEGDTYFEKGYLILPKDCVSVFQSDFSKFLENTTTLSRVVKYNDITSLHPPKSGVYYPSFIGERVITAFKSHT